jgi:nicotianamine synthase-like protein
MQGEDLIRCVLRAHEVLDRESDLSPRNPRINAALSALVHGVMEGCPPGAAARVLADPRIVAIREALVRRLALAEAAMERHWARAFSQRKRLTVADFTQFPYWDCYRHLVLAELRGLGPHLRLGRAESIAFVGAGPLPLSAIMVRLRTGLQVTCFDVDASACSLAQAVCRTAGLTGIEVTCASGAHHKYPLNPVVMIASLVPDKAQVVRRVGATRRAAVVALRSVEGLSTLLYDPVDEAELAALGCVRLGCSGHNSRTINTTLFYGIGQARHRVPDGGTRDGRRHEVASAAQ